MLRMRYVGVFIVALALVLVVGGVASAQGDFTAPGQMRWPLTFGAAEFAGGGMGSLEYDQDSMGGKGWSGSFNFWGLNPNTAYTVRASYTDTGDHAGDEPSYITDLCTFTTNGMGVGRCSLANPFPKINGIGSPIGLSWGAGSAYSSSCTWPDWVRVYQGSTRILRSATVQSMSKTCSYWGLP
ncbi:MAG: hypothetical protein U0641_20370 [Anaerolineae bacterium]